MDGQNLDGDLLTMAEAAEALKVSQVTVARWLKQGRLPSYRLGPRAVRIRRADLASALSPATPGVPT
ncbi:MAG: helix-turn-helix domain-containing protein, partial [Chloroflexota bacterium]|nr:helix-turn-helix domain-containing protein [Chloroflexota bacterium]